MEPKVSVIVTTFNRKDFLGQTIESILAQTYRDFELIVVDNCSNYDFMGFIESFHSDKIRAFQNANHGIIAANRNFGIRQARGEYLAFCDDDDTWDPRKLEKQMGVMESEQADLVSTNMHLFEGDFKVWGYKQCDQKTSPYDFFKKNDVMNSSVLVRKGPQVFFDESKTFMTVEDYLLWARLYMEGYKMRLIEEPLVYYRCHQTGFSAIEAQFFNLKKICVIASLKIQYNHLSATKTFYYILLNLLKFAIKGLFHIKRIKY